MAINKVVYGNNTLLDLTEDTVTEEDVLEGKTFHDKSGQKRTGSATQGGRVQDVEVNGESVVDENGVAEVVVPVSGDVSTNDSFESYTGGKIKSLQMECKPIQDLHGYDHPWVGGAGKNKLDKDNYVLSYTSDNLVIIGTVNIESGKSYTFSCEQDKDLTGSTRNTLAVTYDGNTYYEMVNSNYHNEKGTHTYNFASNYTGTATLAFWCHTPSDTSVTYSKFMFQEGVYTSYEPYENKCPISAHTQAKLEQRGKNRYDKSTLILGKFLNSDGTVSTSGSGASNVTDFISINGTEDVILSYKYDSITSANVRFICFYDEQKNFTDYTQYVPTGSDGYKSAKFNSTSNDARYVRFTLDKTIYDVQVELGSSATDYEPYQGKDYIINLGGTYYWLRGNVVSGKWYVIGQGIEYDGSNDEGWSIQNVVDGNTLFISTVNVPLANYSDKYICSISNPNTASSSASTEGTYVYNSTLRVRVSSVIATTVSDFSTWLSNNPLQIVYKLATPIPLDLTPQQILAIIGENNFSAPLEQQEIIEIVARNISEFNEVIDDENISDKFTYSSEKIEDRLDEYIDKDAVEVKSATTEFETYNGGLLSECKVSLSSNQNLHGYLEPWVGGASKQLIPMTVNALKLANAWMTWNGKVATAVGLTVTLLTDDAENVICIDVDGIASQRLDFSLGWVTDNGSYVISGSTNGSLSKWAVWQRGHGSVESEMSLDGAGTFTDTRQTSNECVLTIFNGATPSHQKFYPMLCLSSAPDPTVFVPYTNICPILGHTEVGIEVGTNKLNPDNIVQGSLTTSASSTRCSTRGNLTIPISVGQTITVSKQSSTINFAIVVTDSSMSVLFDSGWQSGSCTYVSAYDGYVELVFAKQDGTDITPSDVKSANFMVEFGSTPSPYVPYTKGTYSLTVKLGGIYYSGTLDVVTGVFVPDTAKQTYPWGTYTRTDDLGNTRRRILATLSDALGTVSSDIGANISDSVDEQTGWTTDTPHFYIDSSNKTFVVFLPIDTPDSTNIEICYKLATPTPIQLSPTTVKALVGENHLFTPLEGQEITEVKYKEMFDFGDVLEVTGEDYFTLPLQTFTFTDKICNVNDSRVTSNSLVDVYFTSDSMSSVEDAGITVESQNGKIVMTAEEQPVGTIQGRIKVVN